MISTATDTWIITGSLVLVALSAALLVLGWILGRKSLIDGFRMGRMSINQPDIGPLRASQKPEKTRLGDDYDPWNEAAGTGKPPEKIDTVE